VSTRIGLGRYCERSALRYKERHSGGLVKLAILRPL
jgi:hypothetical protein